MTLLLGLPPPFGNWRAPRPAPWTQPTRVCPLGRRLRPNSRASATATLTPSLTILPACLPDQTPSADTARAPTASPPGRPGFRRPPASTPTPRLGLRSRCPTGQGPPVPGGPMPRAMATRIRCTMAPGSPAWGPASASPASLIPITLLRPGCSSPVLLVPVPVPSVSTLPRVRAGALAPAAALVVAALAASC
ncbi:hypothetical protein H696_06213, partial [Fonticula alba]